MVKESKTAPENPKAQSAHVSPDAKYIRRPLLPLPGVEPGNGPKISIMTYNTLAQALINRLRYPTSGKTLRWANRSKAIFEEIGDYRPDILCLQEVDVATWDSEWKPTLVKFGYQAKFYSSKQKKHGIAIAFQSDQFLCVLHMLVDYDKEVTEGMERSKITDNVALFLYLSFKPEFYTETPQMSKKGLIVGTTHLYWHAFASFERTRQTYILLNLCKQFTANMRVLHGSDLSFYTYVAGDFNSQPFDAAYLAITEKPVHFEGITKNGLGRSIAHDWCDYTDRNDDNPDPEHFDFTTECSQQISKVQDLHNSINFRAISLYSLGYGLVHPENAGLDNNKNEPVFSNWTDTWKGLIDYICVICKWDESNHRHVETLEEFTKVSGMRLLRLLKMPAKNEMCPELSGLPQPGMYPSDHLCMMAQLELL